MNLRALELATARFYDWELRGRGWCTYDHLVPLEPAFRPFLGHRKASTNVVDDARKPTFLSGLVERLSSSARVVADSTRNDEPEPAAVERRNDAMREFEILVPSGEKIDPGGIAACIASLPAIGPLCFELIGRGGRVAIRLSGEVHAAEALRSQLRAFFPMATIRDAEQDLLTLWADSNGDAFVALEFGLANEFMLPLREVRVTPDPLTAFVGALSSASGGALALVQVLFEPTRAPWADSAVSAVTSPDGAPFFLDAPDLTSLTMDKLATPLYAVAVRVLVRAAEESQALDILGRVAGGLNQYGGPDRNALVPLAVDDTEDLARDILLRSTHRSGMLLSLAELSSIVRLPNESLRTPALLRDVSFVPALPSAALSSEGVIFGQATHRGLPHTVRLPVEARLQHTHIIGASGTGKSTLLQSLILQDIIAGRGVGVVDPHGDLVDDILARIPDDRIDDVILFDPSDDEGIVGWNILGAHSDIEKELLASDLVSVFRRLSTSWGDQMSVILANAVLAFLESSQGGTLIELRKFLLDDAFRASFLETVQDDHVRSFWREEYPLLIGKKPQAPILTRLDTFLRPKLIRERVTEREKPLNFREIIDSGRIFLAKLSQGAIGEENSALLGSLIVSKFHQVSLSRQNVAREERRPFFLFIDEFQQVATPSMAGLFSGVRKYHLAVTVAHQDLYQLHANAPELERAALTNAYARLVFRVSNEDARRLERGTGEFTASDLTNLGRGEAICRVGRSDDVFRLSTQALPKVDAAEAERRQTRIRRTSAARWGRPRVAPPNRPSPAPSASPPPDMPSRVTSVRPQGTPHIERPKPEVESMPGRGGTMHKYLQGLIGEWARTHGFKVEIERELAEGGRVDVSLTRDELQIACEVAGTTTIAQEIGNLSKCLAAGFSDVCAVSLDRVFLRRLEQAVEAEIPPSDRERMHLFSPEELLVYLGSKTVTRPTKRVAGYAVEVTHAAATQDEANRKRAIAEVMLKSIRRMRDKA